MNNYIIVHLQKLQGEGKRGPERPEEGYQDIPGELKVCPYPT